MKYTRFMSDLIRKNLATLAAGLLLSAAGILSGVAAPAGVVTLHGHVPAVTSQLSSQGRLAATNELNLAIGLSLRNREALTNLLEQIYDPTSPNFHHYLTPEEFTAQFGPTESDYQLVIKFALQNGLKIIGTHPNRMVLDVSGKALNVEKAFHLALHTYKHPTEARTFFAPDSEPVLPAILPIQDVSGLDSYRRPHPHYKKTAQVNQPASLIPKAAGGVTPNAGSGLAGSYIGDDFRRAYVPGSPLNGGGQTIALVQFDGYFASDILAYENLAGRTNVPLQNVLIDGFSGSPGFANDEVCLDIEMVIAMAPALAGVIVYEGDPFNFHPNDVLNRIATDNSARQISCSWGWTGGPIATTDQIFQQMAIQGQSFFTASGDSDAYPAGTVDSPFGFGTPSDSPYVTSVGGTTLTMGLNATNYASETVWNWDIEFGPQADGIGSSGGFSSFYPLPIWQTNMISTTNQGSTTTRNFPDVALTGDNVFVVSSGGSQGIFGGTSCAAPLWAGFTALVNQQATNNAHAPAGFINPALYALARSTNYTNCFHDITTGNNRWSGSPSLFDAVTGYDLCTGLGSPNGTNLINALTSVSTNATTTTITHLSAPLPPYGYTLTGLNGGNPNGTWLLFVEDDALLDTGVISNGWFITLTTANPVGSAADLALSMTASASFVSLGNNIVYTIGVTNYGPSASTNIIIDDTMPTGTSYISAVGTQGSVIHSGSQVTWHVGNLATNAGARLILTLQGNNPGDILNYALVNSDTPDPNPDDDYASATVTIGSSTPPQFTGNLTSTNGTFQLTVGGQSGQSYIIQASTNLVNWVSIYTNPPPYIAPFTFTDANASNYPTRFYRALTGP